MQKIVSNSTMILVIAAVGVSIRLEPFGKEFHPLESSTTASRLAETSLVAKRKTPIPAKITFAGENYISEGISKP